MMEEFGCYWYERILGERVRYLGCNVDYCLEFEIVQQTDLLERMIEMYVCSLGHRWMLDHDED